MEVYNENSMVKKEHARLIADKLNSFSSKVSKQIEEDLKNNKKEEYALSNLLNLACGGGKYRLEIDQIMLINNNQFSIEESAIEYLFKHSITRK